MTKEHLPLNSADMANRIAFVALSMEGIPLHIESMGGQVLAPLLAPLHGWVRIHLGELPQEGKIAIGEIRSPAYFVAAAPLYKDGVRLGSEVAFAPVPSAPHLRKISQQAFALAAREAFSQDSAMADKLSAPNESGRETENAASMATTEGGRLNDILFRAIRTESLDDAVERILEDFCLKYDISDAYVREDSSDGEPFVWHNPGVPLPKEPMSDDMRSAIDQLIPYDANGVFYAPDVEKLDGELGRILLSKGVRRILRANMRVIGGRQLGYVGFEETRVTDVWDENAVAQMVTVTTLLGNMIDSKQNAARGENALQSVNRVMNNINAVVYVADWESYRLRYVNERLQNHYGGKLRVGERCYAALRGRTSPCENCMRKRLSTESSCKNEIVHSEQFIEKTQRWYAISDAVIPWVDGRPAHLECAIDIHDNKLNELRIERMLYYDDMLSIPNRLMCRNRLDSILLDEEQTGFALLLDLDDFKLINDVYGHDAGDGLLRNVVSFLQSFPELRNRLYRFGGDEFVLILEGFTREETGNLTLRIFDTMPRPWRIGEREHYCTISIGAVQFPKDGETGQELLKNAEIAMVEAKTAGKNKIFYYSDEFNDRMTIRLDIERQLRKAVGEGCAPFVLHFQPEFELATGRLLGAEALIRWEVDGVLIPPNVFIPIAEMLGLIVPMGQWALGVACKQAKKWQDYGLSNFFIAVNLSVQQFVSPDFVDIVTGALLDSGLSPECLVLEITESMAMSDFQNVRQKLEALRELGVKTAMDDFGTGYSSLANLRRIPLDIMKLDREFLEDIEADLALGPTFLNAVIELAHSLCMAVCCEGIENEHQREMLKAISCDIGQGFFLGRPMTADDIEINVLAPVLMEMDA